ncbi:SigE family RNA polymerase sigma factor [Jiangella sp. DSM 45060]|uniref:SigE family RNA polymerase sigma factor n=1 Tax=Jiangella sp. DSM 45060 TaxID=1798224 RepID=UPI00087B67BA|nr:SigE family RNA polymerase sigma factor [Jiangella sp. DSM 45060]SDT25936.1 RNA polymerase sigma-70 factor, sigma-E family [Jiangella sp. DSM 45060]
MHAADEASYKDFVTARRRALLRTAFLLTGDWHAAEDLVQEALTKLYVSWRRLYRGDDLLAYARRVLVNAHIDGTRRPWRREHAVDVVPDFAAADPADAGDPYTRERLLAALAVVPPRQRATLVLRFWEDLSVEQVADLLDCSTGNVKSQTARGLDRLRDVLGSEAFAESKEA